MIMKMQAQQLQARVAAATTADNEADGTAGSFEARSSKRYKHETIHEHEPTLKQMKANHAPELESAEKAHQADLDSHVAMAACVTKSDMVKRYATVMKETREWHHTQCRRTNRAHQAGAAAACHTQAAAAVPEWRDVSRQRGSRHDRGEPKGSTGVTEASAATTDRRECKIPHTQGR